MPAKISECFLCIHFISSTESLKGLFSLIPLSHSNSIDRILFIPTLFLNSAIQFNNGDSYDGKVFLFGCQSRFDVVYTIRFQNRDHFHRNCSQRIGNNVNVTAFCLERWHLGGGRGRVKCDIGYHDHAFCRKLHKQYTYIFWVFRKRVICVECIMRISSQTKLC